MFGIALHSPSLISLMLDREKFILVRVPADFGADVQDALEGFFSRKAPTGTRKLLLVEGIETLGQIATLFPNTNVRIIVFDVVDKLQTVTDTLIDVQASDTVRLSSVKASALNPAVLRMQMTALEDFRHNYVPGEEVQIAKRAGRLVTLLKGSSDTFQQTTAKYLLSTGSFAAVKRAGKQEKPRVAKVQTYTSSEEGMLLVEAFMDMALYGTDSKVAALFAKADLEDLRHIASVLPPEADINFKYEIPDRLRLAREG